MTTSYVDYTYYTTTYLGSLIASADFAALALRASAYIDKMTFQRAAVIVAAAAETAKIDSIQMATCAVAEELQRIDQAGVGSEGIKSESIGANSVTYQDRSYSTLSTLEKLTNSAGLYLTSTELLFRGFAEGESGTDVDDLDYN
jgi:hypothetical protein